MPFQKLTDEEFGSFLINSVLISLGSKDNVKSWLYSLGNDHSVSMYQSM